MNENLEKALEQFMLKAIEGAEQAGAFMSEQLPEVVQQALTWYMIDSVIGCFVGIFLILLGALGCYGLYWYDKVFWKKKNTNKNYSSCLDYESGYIFVYVFGGIIGGCVILAGFLHINLDWLKIWITPKLWLVEYAGGLVK